MKLQTIIAKTLRPVHLVMLSELRQPILPPSVSAEPGEVRLARTPYLREPLDRLSPSDPAEVVVFCGPTQAGKSTLALLAWAGWVRMAPAPCLWITDTDAKAEELAKYSVEPVIENTPDLVALIPQAKARMKGNTTQVKGYPGGYTRFSGAQTISGLTSMHARYCILDELDDHNRAGLGDTVRLALGRTTTYGRSRKILAVSSPTLAGESPIWSWYSRGDRRLFYVPCPHCGHMQPLRWRDPETARARLVWPENRPHDAGYLCARCERLIQESQKTAMLAAGEWRPEAKAEDPTVTSYHLSALYAPEGWLSWGQIASEWVTASEAAKRNDLNELRVFINTRLAETWEDRGEVIDAAGLLLRGEPRPEALPRSIRTITCGVDVQGDRLEATWVGWGQAWEAWIIEHRVILGDPHADETWTALDALRQRKWTLADGRTIGTALTCVDAGNMAQRVVEYAKRRAGVLAIRGVAGPKPIWDPKSKRLSGNAANRYHPVGVDTAKDWIASTLRIAIPGPRYVHVFADTLRDHPDWAEQVCSEKKVKTLRNGRPVWAWKPKIGTRQEALDCLVYALAAAHAIIGGRPGLLDASAAQMEPVIAPETRPTQAPKSRQRPYPAPRSGWMAGRGRTVL